MDTSRLRAMGWEPQIRLEEGIASTYEWYVSSLSEGIHLPSTTREVNYAVGF
jgi:dTDP-D-glucose 4,6-dehydratase